MKAASLTLMTMGTLALTGCRPPEAPAELDELAGFLFENFLDEDEEVLTVGLENLDLWMQDNLEETLEGYEVTNLSQEAADALDDKERVLEDLAGAAVGHKSIYQVDAIAEAFVTTDQMELYDYSDYTRDFSEEGAGRCFMERECDIIDMVNWGIQEYPLGIEIDSQSHAQMRWVETASGEDAFLHRTWLTEPANISADWLEVDEQFFIHATMPQADGGTMRLMATWVVARMGDTSVPESMALSLVIDSMSSDADKVDAWIAGE